ncbi:MAG TPA: DNA-deoxyinosine glycosylase [Caproiciproducens sp.]|nr:DNA-deoxyinosine glycosylase [Caproiciproducens sp.]
MEYIEHTIPPVFDRFSKVLVLGTMPSPKSREFGFYYSHPQNRFWRVMADLYGKPVPVSTEEKIGFLLQHHIALWDVLKSCQIEGADDSSIRNPVPNDIPWLLSQTEIINVFTTGSKAAALYRHFFKDTLIPAVPLPSTSPANCRHYNYDRLKEAYRVILPYTGF